MKGKKSIGIVMMMAAVLLMASCRTAKNINLEGVDYETMSSRFRMEVPINQKKIILKGTLKVKHDERIQISVLVPMVRTEAARIEITRDRVFVIDRMNKYYAIGAVEELEVLFGEAVDYDRLQSIFTNDFSSIQLNKEKPSRIKMELSNLVLNEAKLQPLSLPGDRYTEIELKKLMNRLLEAL